jgi:CysZ protein
VAVNAVAMVLASLPGPGAGGVLGGERVPAGAGILHPGRHAQAGAARGADLRARHPVQIWVAGILMAVPLSVPVVNLFIPLLGAATFTHLFHRLNRS